jgi:N-acetylglucosamine kinase-like BadF-type ATPase
VGEVNGVVVAVDGGGSKTDAVALRIDGSLVGRASGPGSSPHFIGVDASVERIDALVTEAAAGSPVLQANVYLSGLDLPVEVTTFASALAHLAWVNGGTVIENDLFALLRTGTSDPNAVAVVCGTGINAVGRRADGETARFAALGLISGDWGGGTGLGESALWHAARATDLRGPATTLTAAVSAEFGLASIAAVTEALHLGELEYSDLGRLAPVVLEHADAGDAIAAELVERQGNEIALMAASCIDRLGLDDHDVPVVLGGGVIATGNERLWNAVVTMLHSRAPRGVAHRVFAPPIVGAALLALESAGATSEALDRARQELES